jgi:uncharacterized protein YwgA
MDLVPKKAEGESFSEYVMENISTTGKKVTIYNKLLYLYNSNDYSFSYSNLGPYSLDITNEILKLKRMIPENKKALKRAFNYEEMSRFLSNLKESVMESGEILDFDKIIELSITAWHERHDYC